MPKPTKEQKERLKKGVRARLDAIAQLIANHQDEFERLHAQNRVAQGLSPTPSGPSREQLEERIRKQEEKLALWRRQLDQAR